MTNKILRWSIFSILFLNSCSECSKLSLTNEEKEWVTHYSIDQSFIFKSNLGKTDTLKVAEIKNSYTPCNKFELSEYQFEINTVFFKFKSENNYNGDEPIINLSTEKWKKRAPYIYLGNLGPYKNDLNVKTPNPIDTIIGTTKLNSVYFFSKDLNMEEYGEKKFFVNFFWNKKNGLIAYTTISGEFFVRVN